MTPDKPDGDLAYAEIHDSVPTKDTITPLLSGLLPLRQNHDLPVSQDPR